MSELADVSMNEDLHLDNRDDGKLYSIAATVTFINEEINREGRWFL